MRDIMSEAVPTPADASPPQPVRQWDPAAPLHLLAMDAGTSELTVAVGQWQAGRAGAGEAPAVQAYAGAGSAQSSATLIPVVLQLLQQTGLALPQLDAIAFGAGPGSFTGLRTACSVAQGLALGAELPLLPLDTLMVTAEDYRSRHPLQPGDTVWALLDARMDEIYVAGWRWQPLPGGAPHWESLQDAVLVRPEDLLAVPGLTAEAVCAGNVQAVYGERLPLQVAYAMPVAEAMLRLAPALLQQGQAVDAALALPRYVRNKVAQTTVEREAARAAAGKA